MKIDKIISALGLEPPSKYQQILGGEDSSVWKIETSGSVYALRILPHHRHVQFLHEQQIINYVRGNGLPVPMVYSVLLVDEFSVMLMEWAQGHTVFQELQENPKNAYLLGYEFGRTQALIHHLPCPQTEGKDRDWLTPSSQSEENIINRIDTVVTPSKKSLLHLDFHPLNVLTDGQKITAVIDWANSTVGDNRFDIARTFSILRLEGAKHFENSSTDFAEFEKGWSEGYKSVSGAISSLEIFYAWAGIRMVRDLAGRRSDEDLAKINQWVSNWL
ncbi:aminoglycoside phosphotransferase family protein [Fredinandcohnia humi]